MATIHTLPLGAYQTNTYIVVGEENRCIVIDPGYDAPTILAKTAALGLSIYAILLTHGHFDHVGAVRELAEETGCSVYLHPEELSLPPMMTAGPLYYTHTYAGGDEIRLCGLKIGVLHTPGHTPGSVCLTVENDMFSGDTLFAGSCGRTDFPGSDYAAMFRSLRLLKQLEKNYTVYPGHGESTTLAAEKLYNPYMQ